MIDENLRTLCTGKNFAALTTLFADGTPQTNVMWVDCDDTHLLVNTEVHRAKFKNMVNDPRVTLMIWEAGDPYTYTEVRGKVVETITGQEAREHINALAHRYMDQDYPLEVESERVMVRIAPDRISGVDL